MTERLALIILVLLSFTVLVCLLLGGPATSVLFGIAGFGFIPALIAVGACRRGKLGSLGLPLALIMILLEGSLIGIFLCTGPVQQEEWWCGLPPATALMLFGLWLAPLLLVSLVYAWHFERFGLTSDDLARIRALSHNREAGHDAEPGGEG